MRYLIATSLFAILFISLSQNAFAGPSLGIGGGSTKISLPARFALSPGHTSATNSFKGYKTDIDASGFTLGADFDVPFKPIYAVIGATSFVTLFPSSNDRANTFFIAPYIGATFKHWDIFIGPAAASVSQNLKGNKSSPDLGVEYMATMKGGFLGIRNRTASSSGTNIGVGINFFYLAASEYEKEVTDSSSVKTKTTIKNDASSTGVMASLMISFGNGVGAKK